MLAAAASRNAFRREPLPTMEAAAIISDSSDFLFAYGTLAPKDSHEAGRDGWSADAVRGRLFDLGPYPALVDLDHEDARWIDGYTRRVTERELRERLDPYEGVSDRLYHRNITTTRSGMRVWVYVYARSIPEGASELAGNWQEAITPTSASLDGRLG